GAVGGRCRLYLVPPPRLLAGGVSAEAFVPVLAAALDAGDVACVQLRLKAMPDDDIRAAAERLRPVVQDRGVALLINDRPDLAVAVEAGRVHVGPSRTDDPAPPPAARAG